MAEQQNRVPLPGSEKQPVAGAEEVGEVHPDERLEVTVRVRRPAFEYNSRLSNVVQRHISTNRRTPVLRTGYDALPAHS